MSVFTRVCVSLQSLVKTFLGSLIYPQDCSSFLDFSGSMSFSTYTLLGFGWTYAFLGDYFAKEGNSGAFEKTLIFVKLQVYLPAYPEDLV